MKLKKTTDLLLLQEVHFIFKPLSVSWDELAEGLKAKGQGPWECFEIFGGAGTLTEFKKKKAETCNRLVCNAWHKAGAHLAAEHIHISHGSKEGGAGLREKWLPWRDIRRIL